MGGLLSTASWCFLAGFRVLISPKKYQQILAELEYEVQDQRLAPKQAHISATHDYTM